MGETFSTIVTSKHLGRWGVERKQPKLFQFLHNIVHINFTIILLRAKRGRATSS